MAFYKLRFDRNHFMSFDITSTELRSKLGSDFRLMLDKPSWSDFWVEMNAQFYDDSDKKNVISIPEITCWITDRLMFSEQAKLELEAKLNQYGEFLPVKCEGIAYYVFNVTNVIDNAVDEEESKRIIEESGYINVEKLSFIEEKVSNNLLFKTHWNGLANIYCNDKFKTMIEQSGYSGLVFSENLASIF